MNIPRLLPQGTTRSRVTGQYALITSDTHVESPLAGWRNASAVIHIAPEMGARFLFYTAFMNADALSAPPDQRSERFAYVVEGAVQLSMDGKTRELRAGQFAFLPSGVDHRLLTKSGPQSDVPQAKLAIFEKRYQPSELASQPPPRIGDQKDVPGDVFMGDDALRLQTLLPVDLSLDMAANIFTYQPGATLPQVEIHVMEHGLLMLDGAGVYRLGDDYHPVQAGDIIWMASYCPQWFVAMGKEPARYLYYKDIHRDRLSEKPS